MKWQYRKHSILRAILVFSTIFILFINTSIGGYCNSTSSGSETNPIYDWFVDVSDLLDSDYMIPLCKIYSLPYVAWDYAQDITVGRYKTWLQTNYPSMYDFIFGDGEEKAQATVHGGGGYIRLSDKINNSDSIEIPKEVSNTLVQYVQYELAQEDLGYTPVKIRSYNYMSSSNVSSFTVYKSLQEFIKQSNGFCSIQGNVSGGSFNNTGFILVIPKTSNYGFYGTQSSGIFSTGQLAINWQTSTQPWKITNSECKVYSFNQNGQFTDVTSSTGVAFQSFANGNSIQANTNQHLNLFTNLDKDETIYLFSSLNAYKNYNAGLPQPYYLTEKGIDTGTWTVTDGTINTGQMNNVGNVYNNIVNNSKSGMSAEEVQKLIESILDRFLKDKTGNGVGGGGSSDDGSFDLGFLGTIGRLIGDLISGIGNLVTGIIGGIVDLIISLIDMITGQDGLINKLTSLFNTDIGGFLTSIFDWLPPEIVTLWSAGIILALLFGILRIIRG